MTIDWSISIGNIISTVTLVCTLLGIAMRFWQRFTQMEKKVNMMFAAVTKQLTAEEIRHFYGL